MDHSTTPNQYVNTSMAAFGMLGMSVTREAFAQNLVGIAAKAETL
jgi:hypothetical protein